MKSQMKRLTTYLPKNFELKKGKKRMKEIKKVKI